MRSIRSRPAIHTLSSASALDATLSRVHHQADSALSAIDGEVLEFQDAPAALDAIREGLAIGRCGLKVVPFSIGSEALLKRFAHRYELDNKETTTPFITPPDGNRYFSCAVRGIDTSGAFRTWGLQRGQKAARSEPSDWITVTVLDSESSHSPHHGTMAVECFVEYTGGAGRSASLANRTRAGKRTPIAFFDR